MNRENVGILEFISVPRKDATVVSMPTVDDRSMLLELDLAPCLCTDVAFYLDRSWHAGPSLSVFLLIILCTWLVA